MDGSCSGQSSAPEAASGTNSSWTGGAGGGAGRRAQPLLELLVVLMCVGAVAGNTLVIVIVAATKTLHSVTSVLIMNLAISDLLVGVGVMPFVAVSILNYGWLDFTGLCWYVGYSSSVYCTASVLTLAAIALDRYHSIMDCLRYSSRCTMWRTSAVVLWIWLQALATSCPPLLGWSSIRYVAPMYTCAIDWAASPGYTAFAAVLSYLLPALVILFCYAKIVQVARSHARRIHTLENSVQRCRGPSSALGAGGCLHCPSRLIYHVSGQFVSRANAEGGSFINSDVADAATEESSTASRRFFSFLAQGVPLQNHHGVTRLFMVIFAFLLCWTPYISVALVQATETAISGQSTLIPSSAVTFSYWLVLLNSDLNPLLYALLSKRFQNALQGLRAKVRAHVGSMVGNSRQINKEGDDSRCNDPRTPTTSRPCPPSSSESLTSDNSKYSSSIFTVGTDLQGHLCEVCHPGNISSHQYAGGDLLQVPAQPQDGSRLPLSAATEERQATFFYGQITVRVEHDV
ncbi:5-hydroxytryptamine receptor 1D [Salarias fasciatus]|uniref:5-hydroxytryptamine receptor 1D n=1 Tax=Salarias fasciatus TaxID=181472 RepID=UPI001176E236|nr:5-hydroxytryptamine receptor 1D-like [Salarias fasciatus]